MKESEFSALSTDKPNNANGSEPVEENKEIVEGCMAGDINIVVENVPLENISPNRVALVG